MVHNLKSQVNLRVSVCRFRKRTIRRIPTIVTMDNMRVLIWNSSRLGKLTYSLGLPISVNLEAVHFCWQTLIGLAFSGAREQLRSTCV